MRAYETEEDLWESYREGEITLEQYVELLALFRAGIDSVFQLQSDLEGLPGYSPEDTLVGPPVRAGEEQRGRPDRRWAFAVGKPELRWGYTLPLREETDEEGYVIGRWWSKQVKILMDSRSKHGRLDGFRKRGIVFALARSRTQVTLGNFEPRYGLGLVVGRRDRVLGRTADTRLSGSLWQPKHSNYNGVQLQQPIGNTVRLALFGSRIESSQYREDIAAAHVSLGQIGGLVDGGLTCVTGAVSDRDDGREFSRNGIGLFVSVGRGQQKVETEIAVADGGAVAAAARVVQPLERARFSLTLWTYDPGFVLPSSGGPGHPGRRRVSLLDDDLAYYSRTAGEQGFLAKVRTPVKGRTTFESTLQVYNDRLEKTKNIEGKLACRVALPRKTSISVYVRGRDKNGANLEESRLYYGVYGRTHVVGNNKSAWRIEYGTVKKVSKGTVNSLRLELLCTVEINQYVRVVPRWRYVDPDLSTSGDGYFYLYISEAIAPFKNWHAELIVVVKGYEDSGRDIYTDVRIRTTWRP